MARQGKLDLAVFVTTPGPGRTIASYRKDDVIFSQGDGAQTVINIQKGKVENIQKGKVEIVVTSTRGKEAVIAILNSGSFFGEGCLLGQPKRLASAVAIADCTVVRIEKSHMVRMLQSNPKFSELFTAYLLTRNSRLEEDLVDQLFNSSEKRLARTLLLLSNFGKDGNSETIPLKISQEILAEMVGTTRPRVSFFMNKFRKLGFIDYNGGLWVHSSLRSVVLRD